MSRLSKLLPFALAALLLLGPLAHLAAQSTAAESIGGLRAYWHVFIAYAVVILLVLAWVVSIGSRLKDIEERLGK
ncbi:MAG: CcmD family protein [Gemmatimonadetes bacterium]|nr:CcmD family protein [Gemmatimonadota bacterium]